MRYCNTEEVSSRLNVNRNQVRRLIREGKLAAHRDGKELLVPEVDIDRFLYVIKAYLHQDILNPDMAWVFEACNYLVSEVSKSGFKPFQVVAIAYGGLVPASMITARLRDVRFYSMRVAHYVGQARLEELLIGDPLPSTISNIPTLVVDDIVDTGATLKRVEELLLEKEVDNVNIKYAVLHKKSTSTFKPNWFVSEIKGWVSYPWEVSNG